MSCIPVVQSFIKNVLIIPYAMSDINSGIATVEVKNLIECMLKVDCVGQSLLVNSENETSLNTVRKISMDKSINGPLLYNFN